MEVVALPASALACLALLVITAYLFHSYVYWEVIYRVRSPRFRLPPGCMGWPLLGSTLEFGSTTPSLAYPEFFSRRQARYGSLFKCHILGCPSIVSTDPAINQFILQKEGTLFKSSYPFAITRLLGESNIMESHGLLHGKLRNLMVQLAGRKAAQSRITDIEMNVLRKLNQWGKKRLILLHEEAKEMAFDLVTNFIVSLTSGEPEGQRLMESFAQFWQGFMALPVNLPGTTYYSCLKSKQKILHIINEIISRRTASDPQHSERRDLLDALLLEETATATLITRPVTLCVLLQLIFAGYETTSNATTLSITLLTRHPHILEEMRKEHFTIQRSKEEGCPLTMQDYSAMTFTRKVLFEALRIGSVVPAVCREAMSDVEMEGLVIPRGWKVYPCFLGVHLDARNYPEPLKFDPWRWKDTASNNTPFYSPFGGGPRRCIGDELAILEMSAFLHHFVTRYRWKEEEASKVMRKPYITFPNSYRLVVERLE